MGHFGGDFEKLRIDPNLDAAQWEARFEILDQVARICVALDRSERRSKDFRPDTMEVMVQALNLEPRRLT